jgi:alanine racemase
MNRPLPGITLRPDTWGQAVATRPTAAVIDLNAIRHNVRLLKPPASELMAVVKANAYGHGDVPIARAALEAGATWLGVAAIEEGIRLRNAGVEAPILVLTEFPRGAERDGLDAGLTPTVYTEEGLRALVAASRGPIGVHVKLDTGMHRVGLPPERAEDFVRGLTAEGLEVEGLWTHFAKAEDVGDSLTARQLEDFMAVVARLANLGVRPRYLHAANSAATIAIPDSHLDLVRVGIAMYGLSPRRDLPDLPSLRPALALRSAVAMVKRVAPGEGISYGHSYRLNRESTIATVPVGYADGYSRRLSGRAEVVIRGRRHPVAGAITMDQIMVDCGDHPVGPGDEVILVGRQGDAHVSVEDLAGWIGTISYEVVCGLSARVPREYVG